MQQSNASGFNINQYGGVAEFKQNVLDVFSAMSTGELVQVTAVEASGLDPVGFVSVKFLTLRAGADNNNIELAEVHNVPYLRLQGGKNAVIIDPAVGDIGYCGICSRDTSLVKRIRAMAAQNVYRVSDVSDAFYFGGWSSQTAEQYIWFDGNDVKIKANSRIVLDAPEVVATGKITATGIIESLADVVTKAISLFTHRHGGVASGSSTTDVPQ